jgi:7-cyano-7-deazaguanine synthase
LEVDQVRRRAVVLLSGGLDSATALAVALREGYTCHALSFDYGQRHRFELQAASRIAAALGAAEHRVVGLDLRAIGGSALTDDIDVPRAGSEDAAVNSRIPVTYVPARNLVFLSLAAGYAEVVGAQDLYIGVNAVDYSGYPDCRPEFIESFEQTVNLGTRAGVEGRTLKVNVPLSGMSKAEIIRLGVSLGVDYSLTHSCYDPSENGAACGRCDSCSIRRRGFAEAGVEDVTRYVGPE